MDLSKILTGNQMETIEMFKEHPELITEIPRAQAVQFTGMMGIVGETEMADKFTSILMSTYDKYEIAQEIAAYTINIQEKAGVHVKDKWEPIPEKYKEINEKVIADANYITEADYDTAIKYTSFLGLYNDVRLGMKLVGLLEKKYGFKASRDLAKSTFTPKQMEKIHQKMGVSDLMTSENEQLSKKIKEDPDSILSLPYNEAVSIINFIGGAKGEIEFGDSLIEKLGIIHDVQKVRLDVLTEALKISKNFKK